MFYERLAFSSEVIARPFLSGSLYSTYYSKMTPYSRPGCCSQTMNWFWKALLISIHRKLMTALRVPSFSPSQGLSLPVLLGINRSQLGFEYISETSPSKTSNGILSFSTNHLLEIWSFLCAFSHEGDKMFVVLDKGKQHSRHPRNLQSGFGTYAFIISAADRFWVPDKLHLDGEWTSYYHV